jgi:hypothetical protein
MNKRIISFKINAQKNPRFSVPERVCACLGVNNEDEVDLVVRDINGKLIFRGTKQLKSGKEIYGRGIRGAIGPYQPILVKASCR